MFQDSLKARCLLSLLIVVSGPASSAPTDESMAEGPAAVAPDAAGAKPIDRVATPDVSSGSRTVDMLIELQGKQVGLGFTAAERAAARTEPHTPKTQGAGRGAETPGATVTRAGLFGSGAIPVAQPSEAHAAARQAEWRTGSAESGSASPAPNPAQRAYESGMAHDDGRISLPRTVVAWIRENRGLVIGVAVVVLIAVGAASMGVAQRRR